jgi:hypothetical protein
VPDGVLLIGLIVIGSIQVWTVRRAWKLARWLRRWRGADGLERAES